MIKRFINWFRGADERHVELFHHEMAILRLREKLREARSL